MTPDLERDLFLRGIAQFNAHDYFDAHETWEEIWRDASGIKRDFFQGLIQCAVALEHYRRSNPRGVISLHRSYRKFFHRLPPVYLSLDLVELQATMERCLQPVLQARPVPEKGTIVFDPSCAPQINLGP